MKKWEMKLQKMKRLETKKQNGPSLKTQVLCTNSMIAFSGRLNF